MARIELTDAMLAAAVRKAVEIGMLPKSGDLKWTGFRDLKEFYRAALEQNLREVVRAALDAGEE